MRFCTVAFWISKILFLFNAIELSLEENEVQRNVPGESPLSEDFIAQAEPSDKVAKVADEIAKLALKLPDVVNNETNLVSDHDKIFHRNLVILLKDPGSETDVINDQSNIVVNAFGRRMSQESGPKHEINVVSPLSMGMHVVNSVRRGDFEIDSSNEIDIGAEAAKLATDIAKLVNEVSIASDNDGADESEGMFSPFYKKLNQPDFDNETDLVKDRENEVSKASAVDSDFNINTDDVSGYSNEVDKANKLHEKKNLVNNFNNQTRNEVLDYSKFGKNGILVGVLVNKGDEVSDHNNDVHKASYFNENKYSKNANDLVTDHSNKDNKATDFDKEEDFLNVPNIKINPRGHNNNEVPKVGDFDKIEFLVSDPTNKIELPSDVSNKIIILEDLRRDPSNKPDLVNVHSNKYNELADFVAREVLVSDAARKPNVVGHRNKELRKVNDFNRRDILLDAHAHGVRKFGNMGDIVSDPGDKVHKASNFERRGHFVGNSGIQAANLALDFAKLAQEASIASDIVNAAETKDIKWPLYSKDDSVDSALSDSFHNNDIQHKSSIKKRHAVLKLGRSSTKVIENVQKALYARGIGKKLATKQERIYTVTGLLTILSGIASNEDEKNSQNKVDVDDFDGKFCILVIDGARAYGLPKIWRMVWMVVKSIVYDTIITKMLNKHEIEVFVNEKFEPDSPEAVQVKLQRTLKARRKAHYWKDAANTMGKALIGTAADQAADFVIKEGRKLYGRRRKRGAGNKRIDPDARSILLAMLGPSLSESDENSAIKDPKTDPNLLKWMELMKKLVVESIAYFGPVDTVHLIDKNLVILFDSFQEQANAKH